MVIMPAPPAPLIALPKRKTPKLEACEVNTPPRENSIAATNMQFLGEKIWVRRAAIGERLDMAIYEGSEWAVM
jgi:hypothetical protein